VCLGTLSFESTYGYLPPGLVGPRADAAPYVAKNYTLSDYPSHGALTFILPYIEQDNLYKQFTQYTGGSNVVQGGMVFTNDPQPPYYWPASTPPGVGGPNAPWWMDPTGNNPFLATTQIPILICPSDDPYASANTFLAIAFGSDDGTPKYAYVPTAATTLGRTDYVPCAGYTGFSPDTVFGKLFMGAFTMRSKTKMTKIGDGASNTIFFGESLGGSSVGARDASHSWMGAAGSGRRFNLPAKGQYYNFSSKHTGVVQFALGDGSVQRFRTLCNDVLTPTQPDYNSASWLNLQRLAATNDGQTIDYTQVEF